MRETTEADVEAIERVLGQLSESYVAGDLETFVDSFTDDVVCVVPNVPPIIGKDAWRLMLRAMFESTTRADHNAQSEEIVVAGDWAFERHNDNALYTSKATGESQRAYQIRASSYSTDCLKIPGKSHGMFRMAVQLLKTPDWDSPFYVGPEPA